ncbi:MAG: CPXCG motif-containing cysteine-rich protein, partial [Planctomycetaceae bacterium]|nr:CPXCG motif-containing cysteine-rich protein [Planctomycetaceae bacterium]
MGCGTQLAERLSLREMNQRTSNVQHEASYICDSCGEEIIVPLDLSAGNHQEYVEDCPVCCRPNVIQVTVD